MSVHASLFIKRTMRDLGVDIGNKGGTSNDNMPPCLETTERKKLDRLYNIVGRKQLSPSRMKCTPQWLLDKAINEEVEQNRAKPVHPIHERHVPKKVGVIMLRYCTKSRLNKKMNN